MVRCTCAQGARRLKLLRISSNASLYSIAIYSFISCRASNRALFCMTSSTLNRWKWQTFFREQHLKRFWWYRSSVKLWESDASLLIWGSLEKDRFIDSNVFVYISTKIKLEWDERTNVVIFIDEGDVETSITTFCSLIQF